MPRILPAGADVAGAFKWMFSPGNDVVLVCAPLEFHADALRRSRGEHPGLAEFSGWIRFLHLGREDFRRPFRRRLLCVRTYPEELLRRDDVEALVRALGIGSRIVFGIDNDKLAELTGDLLRRW